ncbi:MAG TPA: hypothetical protein VHS33_08160 [Sphingomicrobium sp.]|nr:hypothetical protein [Sphingomicrobium sp.]
MLAFILNTRAERLKTLRDHITQSFDETRSDIRQAVSAGVEYWTCSNVAAIRDLEAKVLLFDSDVRSALAAIRSTCTDDELATVSVLQILEAEFLDALTGGNFASTPFSPDPGRARTVIGAGSRLRSDLARLRRDQLSKTGSLVGRATGIFVLGTAIAVIVYAAGLYDGVVIEDIHWASATHQPACSRTIDFRTGAQVVTVQMNGAVRICLR